MPRLRPLDQSVLIWQVRPRIYPYHHPRLDICTSPTRSYPAQISFPSLRMSSLSSTSSHHQSGQGHPPARDTSASPHPSQGSTTAGAMANNPHIAMLLEAEREAAAIVARARQYRVEKLKSARRRPWQRSRPFANKSSANLRNTKNDSGTTTAQMDKEQEERTRKRVQRV